MGLPRILEPELMDSDDEAAEYDAMDHAAVNRVFVDDLLSAGWNGGDLLDLGTGTARIPIELCGRCAECRVMAADAALAMLELGRLNVELAGMRERIQLVHVDAKQLPFRDAEFAAVISNSIVHHIPEPIRVLREAARVVAPGGLIFFRDLLRPARDHAVDELVSLYAAGANEYQRGMFAASLRAALTLEEMRGLVGELGFPPGTVQSTSDRHWTWVARP